ncbi:hypothetical protein DDZ18_07805 [Marinicauda salina]|uniref:Spore coat polysaccharide biosynthesis protein F n=1 Tax=Marinicauda salina TaxID=2135793 RepID=A0A2U2BUA7_9PROT|nr:glycosyltransferase family protein [Marinicauda salina]PWE17567.1 hypothetical protein DDZ18_07805 [Marinicauda salina]
MTVAVIVQARIGSSRLPGKVLEALGAKTALARCLDRCAAIPGADLVVCAVPDTAENDAVAAEAGRAGYAVVRGSETDVLARYADAARAVAAETVMRVTSDCPLIDPAVCGAVIDLLAETGADYACNNMPPRFPHGLDCEAFPAARLFEAEAEAAEPYEREHVTPWLRARSDVKKAALVGPGGGLERLRWTLDRPEDLAFFRAVFDALGESAATATTEELAALCQAVPDLPAINADWTDEARLESAAEADVTRPWAG